MRSAPSPSIAEILFDHVQVLEPAVQTQPALGNQEYLGTDGLDLGHAVGREDHGMILAQLLDEVERLVLLADVEASRRQA
jgi:hypothetical protein